MDRMNHEVARIRHEERQARMARRPVGELRDYRTGNGILRIIRMGRP